MGKRLLLVEDEATLARAVARLLRRDGFEVFLAGCTEEARAAPGRFAFGIFDIDLPDGDGINLARELVGQGVVRRPMFFSGTLDPEQRRRALLLGQFVEKAGGYPALRVAIDSLAAQRHELAVGGETTLGGSSAPPPSGVRPNRKT